MNLNEFAQVIDTMAGHLPPNNQVGMAYRALAQLARTSAPECISLEDTLVSVNGWFAAATAEIDGPAFPEQDLGDGVIAGPNLRVVR